MAEFTVVNLEQVEDMAPKFGLPPGLEAHFARDPLELEASGVSLQRLAPNFRVPFGHKHEEQVEVYVVVSGSARVKLDDEIVELAAWDTIRVPPETMRCFEGGAEGVTFIAFGAPSDENRDADMVQGWWTD